LLDYPPLEPPDLKAPTLWLLGSEDSGAMENVKQYEGTLTGTNVTLKVLSSMSYSDSFMKVEQVMAEIDPFLARVGGSSSVKNKRHGEDVFAVPQDPRNDAWQWRV
jgi:hypothetical protein